MPVENVDASDRVDFGAVAATGNITKMLVMIWLNPDSLDSIENAANPATIFSQEAAGNFGWHLLTDSDDGSGDTDVIRFMREWSGSHPSWRSPVDVVTTGSQQHIGVYYDGSSTANDPRFYVDGIGYADGEEYVAPSGSISDVSGYNVLIGNGLYGGYHTYDGMWADARVYDLSSSSWTEAQVDAFVAGIHGKKSMRLTAPYPVFRCKGNGATGLQVYNGTALAAANTLIDDIGGLTGTPSGSPVGRDDTYLAY